MSPAFGYRIDYRGRSVVLSGDTRVSENLIRFAKGVDVLVHEVLDVDTGAGAPTPRPISIGRTRLAFAAAASRQTIEYLEQRLYPTTTAALALERETPAVRRTLNA